MTRPRMSPAARDGCPVAPAPAAAALLPAMSMRAAPGTAVFRFVALRGDGAEEAGTIVAPDREHAAQQLSARGLFVVTLGPARQATTRVAREARGGRLPAADLALGLRALATLFEAGLPMGRALTAFSTIAPVRWRGALPTIEAAVREGKSLAQALETAPLQIPPVVLGILRAGEAGSGLVVLQGFSHFRPVAG